MIDPQQLIEKYYEAGSPLYQVLITHSRQVCEKALRIADRHPELSIDRRFVEEAAMLHDIGIFRCHAPRIHCFGEAQYIEHGYLGADLLRSEGLPRHALVAERHTGTGISVDEIIRNKLPLPLRSMKPESLEEQLICYADKFYSKTRLGSEHPVEKIKQDLAQFGVDALARFEVWQRIFS